MLNQMLKFFMKGLGMILLLVPIELCQDDYQQQEHLEIFKQNYLS
jgi:hypothetical protein